MNGIVNRPIIVGMYDNDGIGTGIGSARGIGSGLDGSISGKAVVSANVERV